MEERISRSSQVLAGKPYITGTKLTVGFVLEMLKAGYSFETILESYPRLKRQDLQACLAYAIELIERDSDSHGRDDEGDV